MERYSPFGKPFSDVETSDLEKLREVSEGWYIEYKREMPDASAIAKSISAFANTYGGGLFIGVQEKSKENPVAGAFPGLAKSEVDSSLQRIRKSAADILNPTPYFQIQVLWGPDPSLELETDRAVICVWVPQSKNAPHIHNSGRIYRRVSDGSEPKAESDRFILDQLWRRSEEVNRYHKEWFEKDPEFSKGEQELPYVRLMLIADKWGERDTWVDDEEQLREILSGSEGNTSLPFDNIYTTSDGLVGRQLSNNDPHRLGLTWHFQHDLVSDVIIPLHTSQSTNLTSLGCQLNGYIYAEDFIRSLTKYKFSEIRLIDLNYLLLILTAVAHTQKRLCELAKWSDSYFVKVKIMNVWRTVPFLDVKAVIDWVNKYGPPMCLNSSTCCPRGMAPDNYIEIPDFSSELEYENDRVLMQAWRMFWPLALSFGIPTWIEGEDYHQAILDAGQRAASSQQLRNGFG